MRDYLEEVFARKDNLKSVCLCSEDMRDIDISMEGFEYLNWAKCLKCKGYVDLVRNLRSL